jgi:zinc resistance-associated protein
MWKFITALTAALGIASTSFLYAEQSSFPYAQQPSGSDDGQLWQHDVENLHEFDEARLAVLKTGLILTPEQARNWLALEQAARDLGKQRIDRRMAMRSATPAPDPVERMRRRATAMFETSAALKKLADATESLYQSLDENQKQRFRNTESPDGDPPGHFCGREGDGRPRWDRRRTEGGPSGIERLAEQPR